MFVKLRNVIERALILEDSDQITLEYLPGGLLEPFHIGTSLFAVDELDARFVLPDEGVPLERVEMSLVRQAISRCGGNQTRAATLLGISRDQFRYRLKKLEEIRGMNMQEVDTEIS